MDILYCQVKENLSLWLKVSRSTPGSHHQQGTPIRDPPVSSRGGAGHSNSRMLFQKRSTGSVWLSCGHMVSDGNFQGWILASSNRSSQQDQGLKSSDRSGPVPVAIRLLLHLYGAGCSLYIPGSCALQSHSPDIGLQAGLSPWEALGGGGDGKVGQRGCGGLSLPHSSPDCRSGSRCTLWIRVLQDDSRLDDSSPPGQPCYSSSHLRTAPSLGSGPSTSSF